MTGPFFGVEPDFKLLKPLTDDPKELLQFLCNLCGETFRADELDRHSSRKHRKVSYSVDTSQADRPVDLCTDCGHSENRHTGATGLVIWCQSLACGCEEYRPQKPATSGQKILQKLNEEIHKKEKEIGSMEDAERVDALTIFRDQVKQILTDMGEELR